MRNMKMATIADTFDVSRAPSNRYAARPYILTVVCACVLYICLPSSAQNSRPVNQQSDVGDQTPRSGPATNDSTTIAPSMLIGAGDLIDLKVFDTLELSGQLRVDEHGAITLQTGRTLRVAGSTTGQVAATIEKLLRLDEIMLNPHVSVFLVQSAAEGITLLGEVKAPGIYSLLGRHSLYDALAAAGGPTQNQGANITITHRGDPGHPEVVQVHSTGYSPSQQVAEVLPGDIVMVSRASIVYLLGDVAKSGAYYIQTGGPITVLNGITMAGGLLRTASTKNAAIIRKIGNGTRLLPIDLRDVMKLKTVDVVLEAGDILYIPSSEWKRFLQSFGPAAAQAVANAAAISVIAN
jgi:polysaccharide export outer membrane protein